MTVESLFTALWNDYVSRLCPSALRVHELLRQQQPLINDHIALRTFAGEALGLNVLAAPLLKLGYVVAGDYQFKAKKLRAQHFQHANPELPKVFISELKLKECSPVLQEIVSDLLAQVNLQKLHSGDFLFQGRLWNLSYSDYQQLAQESEYAAWVAAHGYGANHFTVSVNQLAQFTEVAQVNAFLRNAGFTINESGGEVKGSPSVLLEQSSTMADRVNVTFSDTEVLIPGGFYEFAKRYPQANGELYNGFVEASADKIFESTDHK